MNELELIPAGFGLCWVAYYFRGILRLHRSRVSRERTTTFWETWLSQKRSQVSQKVVVRSLDTRDRCSRNRPRK